MAGILKKSQVRLADEVERAPAGPLPARAAPARPRCAKKVELLRIAGVVHALEVRCACGETTVIELLHEVEPE